MSFLSNVFHLSDLNLQNIGQCYIYTLNNNVAWGRISTNIAEILKKMDNSTFAEIYIQIAAKNRRDIPQLLTLFEKLTVIQKQSIQRNDKKVFFIITRRCNLNCSMCYINASQSLQEEMSYSQIEIAFKKLIESGYRQITISGGEPFIYKDIIRILSLATEMFDSLSVNTNGTLLTEEYLQYIMQYNIHVMISLEGNDADTNDKIRGNGTYQKIKSVIKYFVSNNYFNISVSITITKYNFQKVKELYQFCSENKINVNLGIFIEEGRGKINNEDYKLEPLKLLEVYMDILEIELNEMNFENKKNSANNMLLKCAANCGAINNQINVMENGDIYPCQNLIDAKWKMGNILEDDLQKILEFEPVLNEIKKRNVNSIKECKACPYKYICSGGCMANSYLSKGSIYLCDPMCSFYKMLYNSYLNNWVMGDSEIKNVKKVVEQCRKNYLKD